MKFLKDTIRSLRWYDIVLWLLSVAAIVTSFLVVQNRDYVTLSVSLVGVTSLIFIAKGNVIGQFLMVAFAALYGVVSYSFAYYGEMITYLGMTAPIAIASIVTWIRHASSGNSAEVKVNSLKWKEYIFLFCLAIVVTVGFYFLLRYFQTPNLLLSTFSVFTSFIASYLEMRRSEFYAIGFVANDMVLIVLWTLATISSLGYLPMIVCFSVFLVNDFYGFVSWSKTKRRQRREAKQGESEQPNSRT